MAPPHFLSNEGLRKRSKLLSFLAYLDHCSIWHDLINGPQAVGHVQAIDVPPRYPYISDRGLSFEVAMAPLVRYYLIEAHYQA